MRVCPKCHRAHRGLCGIPAGVTMGFGARVGGLSQSSSSQKLKGKVPKKKLSTAFLEGALVEAKEHYQLVLDSLKVVPKDILEEEYNMLLDGESKAAAFIKQLEEQIGVRKTK